MSVRKALKHEMEDCKNRLNLLCMNVEDIHYINKFHITFFYSKK